jgi:hypothetical protein
VSNADPQLQATLATAERTIAAARPRWWMVCLGALAGAALGVSEAHQKHTVTPGWAYAVGAVGGAVLGVVAAFFIAKQAARRKQTDRYYTEFAAARGWTYNDGAAPNRDTWLLRAGDGQTSGPSFELTIDGLRCRLYEHIKRVGSGKYETFTHYVVLVTHVAPAGIARLSVRPHALLADGSIGGKVIHLESEELDRRFVIEVDAATDETRVRQLFDPVFITTLLDFAGSNCYLGDRYEAERGSLVLASEGTIVLEDGSYLDATVQAIAPILAHFRDFGSGAAPPAP